MSWRQHAACRNEDAELFFPVGTGAPALRQAEEAKAICHTCPVAEQCLEWALETKQQYGVWGGLDENQRRALATRAARRRLRAAS